MSNFDVEARTILKVCHGSHAYGLNVATSDVDTKGVCIEPREYHLGFLHRFEQHIRLVSKGHSEDCTIFSLKKFCSLAANCNPNVIEILFVDDSDVLQCDEFGELLRANRDAFISKLARHTFAGYAHSQLKRIKTHRAWLLDPPKREPSRDDFCLPKTTKVSKSELGAYQSLEDDQLVSVLPKDIVTLFTRERAYQAAKTHWDQYQNWVKTRNPVRAVLEANFGYDVKHGMHLIRLMRMCHEILSMGKVVVKRPDREELLGIRNGRMSYDEIIEHAEQLDAECAVLYETSQLPHSPDRAKLDELVVNMTDAYLKRYG